MTEPTHQVIVRSARVADIAPTDLYRILWLRVQVFVVEQAAAYEELDGRDIETGASLFWVEEDGHVLATLRLLDDGEAWRIGRVATAASARGRGLAGVLMDAAIADGARRADARPYVLDAQLHLAGWYGRYGFVVDGPEFIEDDIPHVPMRRA